MAEHTLMETNRQNNKPPPPADNQSILSRPGVWIVRCPLKFKSTQVGYEIWTAVENRHAYKGSESTQNDDKSIKKCSNFSFRFTCTEKTNDLLT